MNQAKIYIAEDCATTARIIKITLEQGFPGRGTRNSYWNGTPLSFHVVTVHNGRELLALLGEGGFPDLLILDIMMPEMSGYEVLKALNRQGQKLFPVIVVTALRDHGHILHAFDLGADDVLIKPFCGGHLLAKVYRLITTANGDISYTVQLQYETIVSMCRLIEQRDNATGQHVDRVGQLAYCIARKLGLYEQDGELIRQAAKVHDIGKAGIPDRILLKRDSLSKEEFEILKTHPLRGAEVIGHCRHSTILSYARSVVLHHHERWDGRGYPHGLKGEEIPLASRIASVADVFDALTHPRPYKDPWSHKEALEYMHSQRGSQFDAEIVKAFLFAYREKKGNVEEARKCAI